MGFLLFILEVAEDITAAGAVRIDASRIDLQAGLETSDIVDTRRLTELGVTLAVGGTYIDGAKAIDQYIERADEVENERLERVKQLQAAYKAYQLYQAAIALADATAKDSAALRVSLTGGYSEDETVTTTHSETAISSALLAGNNLTLTARGREGDAAIAGDILSRGSVLSAGNAVALEAVNDIQLLSAANRFTSDREHLAFSAGGGIAASYGGGGGASLGGTAYGSVGYGTGDELTLEHQETTIDAKSFTFASGRDTTLRGAVVKADSIEGNVGRHLTLASEQDRVTFGSEDMSLGGSVTFGYGVDYSVSASAGEITSDYLSVIEQTGLFAGKGGFTIQVGGHTDLTGAVIASTASADQNSLDTRTLAYRDLENHAEWSMDQATAGTGLVFGLADGDSDHNNTRAAIAAGTLTVRDDAPSGKDSTANLLRDTTQAHQVLGQNFDETEVRETAELVQSVVELGTTIRSDMKRDALRAKAAQDYLDRLAQEGSSGMTLTEDGMATAPLLTGESWTEEQARAVVGDKSRDEIQRDADRWATGGIYSLGTGVLTGALGGGLGDMGLSTSLGLAANASADDLNKLIGDFAPEGSATNIGLHILLGATQGLSTGNVLASTAGATTSTLVAPLFADLVGNTTLEERKTVAMLTTLASGVAGAAAGDASGGEALFGGVSGANTGHSAVVHNYLSHVDIEALNQKLRACKGDRDCEEKARVWARQRDRENSEAMAACQTDKCRLAHAIALQSGNLELLDPVNTALAERPDIRREIADVMNPGDAVKVDPGLMAVAKVAAFALDQCGGAWSDKCLVKWNADQARKSANAKLLIAAIFAPAAAVAGTEGLAALGACLTQVVCVNELAIGAMDVVAGDAVGGVSLVGGAAASVKLGEKGADALRATEKLADDAIAEAVRLGDGVPNSAVAYRLDLPKHLAGPDGFTKSGSLSGTHNLVNATASLDAKGATYSLSPTGTNGISELKYTYTNPATGKLVSGSKTVYDPAVLSDQAMLDYSMKAGEAGWKEYLKNPSMTKCDVSYGGVNFRTYINFDKYGNPFVGNVHPIK